MKLNYTGNGWFIFFLGVFALGGWTYLDDIKFEKGRKERKIYDINARTHDYTERSGMAWVERQLAKGDP